jgi:hypothetical protein
MKATTTLFLIVAALMPLRPARPTYLLFELRERLRWRAQLPQHQYQLPGSSGSLGVTGDLGASDHMLGYITTDTANDPTLTMSSALNNDTRPNLLGQISS